MKKVFHFCEVFMKKLERETWGYTYESVAFDEYIVNSLRDHTLGTRATTKVAAKIYYQYKQYHVTGCPKIWFYEQKDIA